MYLDTSEASNGRVDDIMKGVFYMTMTTIITIISLNINII